MKGPAYGFHLWLPLAHVEASTVGRVLLAGVLLKLAFLVLIRFKTRVEGYGLPIFFLGGGLIRGWLRCLQRDSKKLVAYSRVCHIAVGLTSLRLRRGLRYRIRV